MVVVALVAAAVVEAVLVMVTVRQPHSEARSCRGLCSSKLVVVAVQVRDTRDCVSTRVHVCACCKRRG